MDIKNVKAFGPWILVEVDPPEKESKGGIILPDGMAEHVTGYATGTALSVGQGKFNDGKAALHSKFSHSGVTEGEKVYFRRYLKDANRPLGRFNDGDYSLIHQDDIVGVVEE